MYEYLPLALGLFVGNWLLVPIITTRTRRDGFWIGVICVGILSIYVFVRWLLKVTLGTP